ncbi:hypothetical protein NKH85_12535 [Mesorhizobium sp. M0924]|uniref:hypothetical protein n=1 Tax=unclassified Mesorhizobium TaxID=325217 RepID=UPI0033383DB8
MWRFKFFVNEYRFRALWTAVCIVITAVVVWAFAAVVNRPLEAAILSGVLASLATSSIFLMTDKYLGKSRLNLEQVYSKLGEISAHVQSIRRLGIRDISSRAEYNDEFWKSTIRAVRDTASQRTELIMVGRTLEKWTGEAFAQDFAEALIRVLNKGGSAKLITLSPTGRVAEATRKHSDRDVTRGAKMLDEFIETRVLPKVKDAKRRERLETRRVDDIQLTFTMFKSDTILWTSPYLSLADTSGNLAISLEPNTPLAAVIVNDFRRLWEAHQVKPAQLFGR